MRLLLEALPHVALTRRTYMWPRFYQKYGDLRRSDNLDRCLDAMLREPAIQALHPDRSRIRAEFGLGAPTYGRLFGLFHAHHAEQRGAVRWGEQLAFVERYAEPIFADFPHAKMIHMVRDPRTRHQAASRRARHRKGKLGWSTALWLNSVSLMKRNVARYPDGYMVVRYEALMARPKQVWQAVCAFLGESAAPCVAARGSADTEATGALPVVERAFLHAQAGREMRALGYADDPLRLSMNEKLSYFFVEWPINRAAMAAWRAQYNRRSVGV